MYLRRLELTNFRCYRHAELDLPDGVVVVAGRNAQGKSSLLEAVYVLATTRSPTATNERELIGWEAEQEVLPFSRVSGEVERAAGRDTLEVVGVLQPSDGGEPRFQKRARVNGAARRAIDLIGVLNVVLFTPRDIQIVDGAPAERRRFLDVLRCQVDHTYCVALARLNRVVAQRNHLLRRLRDRGGDRGELHFWDRRFVTDAALVVERRLATVATLNELVDTLHAELAGDGEALSVGYRTGLDDNGTLPAERPALEDLLTTALAARREEEIARGMTTVGPHRDDLVLTVRGVDVRTFGSRGQQRTATLALKLAEARLMWRETGERPVLLLDDVLSELDAERREHLLAHVDAHQQTFITTTDPDRLPPAFVSGARLLTVEGGRVKGVE